MQTKHKSGKKKVVSKKIHGRSVKGQTPHGNRSKPGSKPPNDSEGEAESDFEEVEMDINVSH